MVACADRPRVLHEESDQIRVDVAGRDEPELAQPVGFGGATVPRGVDSRVDGGTHRVVPERSTNAAQRRAPAEGDTMSDFTEEHVVGTTIDLQAALDLVVAAGAHVPGRVRLEESTRQLVPLDREVRDDAREVGAMLQVWRHRHAIGAHEAHVARRRPEIARDVGHVAVVLIREVVAAPEREQLRADDVVHRARQSSWGTRWSSGN